MLYLKWNKREANSNHNLPLSVKSTKYMLVKNFMTFLKI